MTRVRRLLPPLLVLALVLGGAGWTGWTVRTADRTAPTSVVTEEPADPYEKDDSGKLLAGRKDTPLSRRLLPVPDGYTLGPDVAEFGNDASLSGKEAAAVMRRDRGGLSASGREAERKIIDDLDVGGMAVRSYQSRVVDHYVTVRLLQADNRTALRGFLGLQEKAAEFLDLDEGPRVEGHGNADCSVLPAADEDQLESMACVALVEDVLVSVEAYGTEEMDRKAVAGLVEKQLDRLVDGGGTAI